MQTRLGKELRAMSRKPLILYTLGEPWKVLDRDLTGEDYTEIFFLSALLKYYLHITKHTYSEYNLIPVDIYTHTHL